MAEEMRGSRAIRMACAKKRESAITPTALPTLKMYDLESVSFGLSLASFTGDEVAMLRVPPPSPDRAMAAAGGELTRS
jgi:hypothetical protein